jgi:phosphoglycerate dehydrogenase-like enzyme
MKGKKKAILLGSTANLPYVYPEDLIRETGELVDWVLPPAETAQYGATAKDRPFPQETEVIFSTWGMPRLDEDFLDKLPNLRAVFYGAGSVRGFVTDASWARGIRIFSAAQANAVPVAEYTVAQLILGLKHVYQLRIQSAGDWNKAGPLKDSMQGNFKSRVGLVSYGAIARLVRKILRSFDYEILVYDPFLSGSEAAREGIRLVGLEELFKECHAVSIHAPLLNETHGLIRGHHLELMGPNAVFINTSRGAIVNQPEMVDALRKRPDLLAILDVLHPEPPSEGDPILQIPNAWVTPHVAGSMGHECGRMGAYIVEAYRDFMSGKPNRLEVKEADMAWIA